MKMQETQIEFVVFDAADVIMTSGGGSAATTTMIWLPYEVANGYNKSSYVTGGASYKLGIVPSKPNTSPKEYYKYYSFEHSYNYNDEEEISSFHSNGYQDATPDPIFASIANADSYKRIFDWLNNFQ